MLEIVTGLSLAAAAGLNAYIPLLGIGLLARFTPVIDLPDAWSWIANEWVLGILGILLVVELVVDKVPALDSVNDVLQTIIRPTSGGLVFSAGSASDTVAVTDPEAFVNSAAFWPFVIGVVIALVPHIFKLVARPVVNLTTGGAGAGVMSAIEDIAAVIVTILAVVVPLLALAMIVGCIILMVRAIRKMRKRRAARSGQQPITES
ncbi:DUF4126 domain-containing protein [Leucobacter denitrificans]|uniref:DUF4126 domain-containing protein n=1 Tax=Leucobacter denitrificans TaxID=683042 RepID=A0A7G9S605_9MICO|nr:DUF4126 domain-containing protein [Leucobacter denitrificans]QNN63280.1 DUF4126 domain-containing protein [Leucobacter denitrificans]